jgi:hypothetical protein
MINFSSPFYSKDFFFFLNKWNYIYDTNIHIRNNSIINAVIEQGIIKFKKSLL